MLPPDAMSVATFLYAAAIRLAASSITVNMAFRCGKLVLFLNLRKFSIKVSIKSFNYDIHHGGGSRIEGSRDRPHLGPWEQGQGNDMQHLTYRCHGHKLSKCETYHLWSP